MSNVKSVIESCIFALLLTEVTSWTIDLPEVMKYYFERNEYKNGDKNKIYFNRQPELVNYNNIEGNSMHNTPLLHIGVNGGEYGGNGHYADDYGYYAYMEKNVQGIYQKGSIYLEGLRQAMQRYTERLNYCSGLERSRPQTNRTWIPEIESQLSFNATEQNTVSCEKLTRESEHVKRLSSLIVWVIRELQDIAYAKDYDKDTKESEEDVLLLQLAWALDELARLTGFEPDAGQYATTVSPAPAPTTAPITFFGLPIPNDGPAMSNCIKDEHPAVPATIRCAVPIPEVVLQFLNMSNTSLPATTSSPNQDVMSLLTKFQNSTGAGAAQALASLSPDELRQRMPACLAGSTSIDCLGLKSFIMFLNNNSVQQQIPNPQPRANRETDTSKLEILEATENHSIVPPRKKTPRTKRSAKDPLKEFAQYYIKYKTWSGTNPLSADDRTPKSDSYDVKNDLAAVKKVYKRSVSVKNGIVIKVPEDPMQDLSYYEKHKPSVRYNKDFNQAEKIKAYLDKLRHSSTVTAAAHVRKLNKLIKSVHKRSVHYSRLHRPRVPEDPMQDLSYYVKSKSGTNIRPNLANAARVRLGLREVFERGNIEVVRRYGSNYIPGVRPLVKGQMESFADV